MHFLILFGLLLAGLAVVVAGALPACRSDEFAALNQEYLDAHEDKESAAEANHKLAA